MRQQLIAMAGVIGLAGAATAGLSWSAGTAWSAGSARPAVADVSRAPASSASYLFGGLAPLPAAGAARAAAASGAKGATSTTAPSYTYFRIRFGGSLDTQTAGINYSGATTGNVTVRTGATTSKEEIFIDSGRRGAKPVLYHFPYKTAGLNAVAAGIDSDGDIVGNYYNAAGVFHGFERGHRGVFRELSIKGAGSARGEGTEIAGISPGGIIVGSFVTETKAATGFIDDHGHITEFAEKNAGTGVSQGTAVEFDYDRVYGGLYVGPDGSAHGWYVKDGLAHTVDDPISGPEERDRGTQLVGLDKSGRLYGIVSPDSAPTGSFSLVGSTFSAIADPHQTPSTLQGTVVNGVNSKGDIAGFYVYDASTGQSHAFYARPRT